MSFTSNRILYNIAYIYIYTYVLNIPVPLCRCMPSVGHAEIFCNKYWHFLHAIRLNTEQNSARNIQTWLMVSSRCCGFRILPLDMLTQGTLWGAICIYLPILMAYQISYRQLYIVDFRSDKNADSPLNISPPSIPDLFAGIFHIQGRVSASLSLSTHWSIKRCDGGENIVPSFGYRCCVYDCMHRYRERPPSSPPRYGPLHLMTSLQTYPPPPSPSPSRL